MKKLNCFIVIMAVLLGCFGCNQPANQVEPENEEKIQMESPLPIELMSVLEIDDRYSSFEQDIVFIDAFSSVFTLGGIEHPLDNNHEYYRLDAEKKDSYSWENSDLAHHTSGASLRFVTNAKEIMLRVALRNSTMDMPNMSARGSYGFDVYVGSGVEREYCGKPMQYMTDPYGFTDTIELSGETQEVMIHLPLYAGIEKIEIGFPREAGIAKAPERAFGTIAFYGSSITQGACVSRPGLSYSNIICRMMDADNMNLGFAGSARGEQEIAEYIASREIDAFVMDYDYNNTPEGLEETHYAFYETVRKAHPDIPIIMVTRPVYTKKSSEDQIRRQQIIQESYDKAVANGDTKVYYVNGNDFFDKTMPDLTTTDMTHPNDLGHYHMAMAIGDCLEHK